MLIRSLRTKIAVNLAVMLLLAMMLIDLVSMATVRRQLIRSEVGKADLLLGFLTEGLSAASGKSIAAGAPDLESTVLEMINADRIQSALLVTPDGDPIHLGRRAEISPHVLLEYTKKAIAAGEKRTHFSGSLWGIFWRQKAGLILSAPLLQDGRSPGGISIVLSLKEIANSLKDAQQLLFIYIIINLVLLTYIGIRRISKLYLSPLARLAKRAEDYKEDDEILFAVRREDNELNRLSKSLNRMLKRISADREKLRSTVLSLENANLGLRKAQREIIQAEKLASVGRLSAGIAHEIGNPIGIVIGYLDLIKQRGITGREREEYIRRTEEEIQRINTIIRQLLEVSRPSNAGRRVVSVHELIRDTADVLRIQPLMSSIELSLDLAAAEDTVWADPNQLRQVFLNLTINAADAVSGQGTCGRLEIATRFDRDGSGAAENRAAHLKILFVDDGPGIAGDDLDNIFDPFFTTKEPGSGTGLGLSVSFMIVESLGGGISAASEVGKGTTMTITLPLHRRESGDEQGDA